MEKRARGVKAVGGKRGDRPPGSVRSREPLPGDRAALSTATPSPDTPGFAARRFAWAALVEALRRNRSLDDALALPSGLDKRDLALARAIALTTFRHLGTIRAALAQRLAQGAPAEESALALLAIGAAQVLYLDVPDHAAVDLSVALARSEPHLVRLAGLTNAVLRRLAREREAVLAGAQTMPLVDAPDWLAERWTLNYGSQRALAIAAAHRAGAALDISVKADPDGWAAALGGVVLPTGSVRLPGGTAVPDLPGYAEGGWWVQDAAAALPARLLAAQTGERVADLCAAPGGKTAQLALAGASVVAVDRSAARLARLDANMRRLGLAVETVTADAISWAAGYAGQPFDAVLVDASCTATGTIRRHPDVAWTKRPADLLTLSALQARLLDAAARLVRPGGRIVFCTCSLEPEEGEDQAAAFLARHGGFVRLPAAGDWPAGVVNAAGEIRTAPDLWSESEIGARPGLDGFFACAFRFQGGPEV